MMDEINDIPRIALEWLDQGRKIAIATVIKTWGSAPRRVGAQLVIDQDGKMMGSVSGGCVEGSVIFAALDALETGKSKILEFGIADEDAFEVGLACGGEIEILVQPVGASLPFSDDHLRAIVAAGDARESVLSLTDLGTFNHAVRPAQNDMERHAARMDRSQITDEGFICVYNPPLRMIIVGAVHIAQPLVIMARLNNFEPVVIDPRGSFATQERFPDTTIIEAYPDAFMDANPMDARTALIALTHDPKIDDKALVPALSSDAFYVGALGSKRTHAKRLERLSAAGLSAESIGRIHAPIGLDIGAANPSEIATSIMGEVISSLRQD